jgi:glucokinase
MTGWVLGIDLGGTNIKFGLVNPDGKIEGFRSLPTKDQGRPEQVLLQLKEIIGEAEKTIGRDSVLQGIGLAVPGIIDIARGICIYSPNLGWENLSVAAYLSDLTDLEVRLFNDANAACLGEYFYGAGKGSRNLICVTLGTGVGTAFILDGRLFLGRSGCAGEAGHMVVMPDGPLCSCGRRGCWESLVSATAITNRARGRLFGNKGQLSAKEVFDFARSGDPVAQEILEEMKSDLVTGLANLVNIFNPDRIVLGGGVVRAGEILFSGLEQRVKEEAFPGFRHSLQIKPSGMGTGAGVIGAAALWFKEIKTIGG